MNEALIFGVWLTGEKAGQAVEGTLDLAKEEPKDLLWLHFDYSHPGLDDWLLEHTRLDRFVVDALVSEETRPRVVKIGEGMLGVLRGVNQNPESDPEDMVAIRFWVESRLIVSTRKRRLRVPHEVLMLIQKGEGPTSSGGWVALLSSLLVERMQETIDEVEIRVDELEEHMLEANVDNLREDLAKARRQAITLRRYLSPQREALTQMQNDKFVIFSSEDRANLRENAEHLIRYLEDLDSVRDRAAVTQEELGARMSEQMNNRMYVLSIVTMIFLPLGFLTGLLGINVGGMPGVENQYAFTTVVLIILVSACVQIWYLKRNKWF